MLIHLIGVAGTGMGALASLLQASGHEVRGSDVSFDPPMGPALRAWGIPCLEGFDPAHLEPTPDVVVVGNVCRRDNCEARAAFERGLQVMHIASALQHFVLSGTSPLVVTGTHGKTTTTALAAFLLDRAGLGPGFLIGGLPVDFERSARAPCTSNATFGGRRVPFVLEGDEYDTAYFEKTAKFLHYQPEVVVLTSLEHDHVDIYPTFEAYRAAFEKLLLGLPPEGLLVANCGDPEVAALLERVPVQAEVLRYGLLPELASGRSVEVCVTDFSTGPSGSDFSLRVGEEEPRCFSTSLTGDYNLANAAGALVACARGFGVPFEVLSRHLPDFRGVARRQQLVGVAGGVRVIDDFAHHPTAVKKTLRALRARFPEGRLFAVFEPRSATACRRLHQTAYATAFSAADEVLLPPLGRDLPSSERLDVAALTDAIRSQGQSAFAFGSVEAIVEHLVARARPSDCIAVLSNGAFGGIHRMLLARLEPGHP